MAAVSSKKSTWIALAGLAVVPLVGVIVVESLDRREERPGRNAAPKVTPVERATVPADSDAPARRVAHTSPRTTTGTVERPPAAHGDDSETRALAKIEESRRIENTDPKRARALLREAIAMDPRNETALERLAMKMLIDENNEDARALAQRCLGVSDSNPACAAIKEDTVEDGPNVDAIVAGTEKCLQETPDNLMCLYGMVNYHLMKGQPSDAAMFVGRLTQASPDNPFTQYARGRVRAAAGEYSEALRLFQSVCRMGNEDACLRADTLRSEGW
jgi:predicted Zn-dependent protease